MESAHNSLCWRLLLVIALVFNGEMFGISSALAPATGSVTSAAMPSNATPDTGDTITVTINIDMTGVNPPDNYLGSFSATLDWNPAVLAYQANSGLLAGFSGVVNTTNVGTGSIFFNGTNITGATGDLVVFQITFDVVGMGTSAINLGYTAIAAAGTFATLLPILTVTDGEVVVGSVSVTQTLTPTLSPTPVTPTLTSTRSPTPVTPTLTPTRSLTPEAPTLTPTRSLTPDTPTLTPTRSPTPVTPTLTSTRSPTPATPTPTPVPLVTLTLTPTRMPGLEVHKVDNPDPVEAGSRVYYTIYITNTTWSVIDSLQVVDTLPDGTYYISSDPAGQYAGDSVTWNVPSLDVGAHSTLSLVLGTYSIFRGTVSNDVRASGAGVNPVSDTETTTIVGPPGEPTATHTPTPTVAETATVTPIPIYTLTPSHTAVATQTAIATASPTPTVTIVATATASPTPTVTLAATATRSPLATVTTTATASPTPTHTPSPTVTPTATSAGSYQNPIAAMCDSIYAGDTSQYADNRSDYGDCGNGMSGPDVVYALDVSEPLAYLELNFGAAADLRLLLVSDDGSAGCLGAAGPGGSLVVSDLIPARPFIIVDGYTAGVYFIAIHCRAATPTATPLATPTRTAAATPMGGSIFLPLVPKTSSSWGLCGRYGRLEHGQQ